MYYSTCVNCSLTKSVYVMCGLCGYVYDEACLVRSLSLETFNIFPVLTSSSFSLEVQDPLECASGILDHFLHLGDSEIVHSLFPSVLGLDVHPHGPSNLLLRISQVHQDPFALYSIQEQALAGNRITAALLLELVNVAFALSDISPPNPYAGTIHTGRIVTQDSLVVSDGDLSEANLQKILPSWRLWGRRYHWRTHWCCHRRRICCIVRGRFFFLLVVWLSVNSILAFFEVWILVVFLHETLVLKLRIKVDRHLREDSR
mmetsp:Transcript_23794/g.40379  ORF Transcript_23794/g.40379 Transcript_23794/m.40379 type:complete len:259 (+) Transcript_23794:268-1044(+)